MSKKWLPRLLACFSLLLASVLWLLSLMEPDYFGAFNLSWAVVILAGLNAISFLISAFMIKNSTALRRVYLIGAGLLAAIAAACVAFAVALPKQYVLPIVAVTLSLILVIGVLMTGGKKWDEGDNQKAGYRDYRQRKEEAERGDDGEE